jgi:hypothetical protein
MRFGLFLANLILSSAILPTMQVMAFIYLDSQEAMSAVSSISRVSFKSFCVPPCPKGTVCSGSPDDISIGCCSEGSFLCNGGNLCCQNGNTCSTSPDGNVQGCCGSGFSMCNGGKVCCPDGKSCAISNGNTVCQ